jgi:hypothetical protein
VPDTGDESVAEDAGEDDSTSSPRGNEDEALADKIASPSPKNPLEGKIREPRESDSGDEYKDSEADEEAAREHELKRKREAVAKKPTKKQNTASNLVHTKITEVVKPAPAKAAQMKTSKAKAPIEDLASSESSNDSDDPSRVKG